MTDQPLQTGPQKLPQLKTFALLDLTTPSGLHFLGVKLILVNKEGDTQQIQMALNPKIAQDFGKAISESVTLLGLARH